MISRVFTWLLGACLIAALAALVYTTRLDPGYTGAEPRRARGLAPADGNAPQLEPTERRTNAAHETMPPAKRPRSGEADATEHKPPAAIAAPEKQVRPDDRTAVRGRARQRERDDVRRAVVLHLRSCARLHARARRQLQRDRHRAAIKPARASSSKLNRDMTVPTFEIDGQAHVGFNPWELEDAIRDAAMQRYSAQMGRGQR